MTDRNDAHEPAEAAEEHVHEEMHDDAETYKSEESAAAPPARQPRSRRRPPRREVREAPIKSPLLAAFLGFVPGLGNIYNGLYARGFVFFLLVVSLFYAAIDSGDGPHLALLIPSLIFTWLFNIFDGYRQATLINWGWDEREEIAAQQGSGGLAAGIALFAIGLYGLLHQFFDVDLSALLEHWYLILLAIGGWLIYQSWSEKKGEASNSY